MNKITFCWNNRKIEFIVDRIKYLPISKIADYWCLNRCIYKHVNNHPDSEFADESGLPTFIKIDDEKLSKHDKVYFVNLNFSFDDDIKLGTASLIGGYISSMYKQGKLFDDLSQLNSMLQIIALELSDDDISFIANEVNAKLLVKLLRPIMYKDELEISGVDFNYDDSIIFQLKIIEKIRIDERNLILIDIPVLTKRINDYINNMLNSSIKIIIFQKSEIELQGNNMVINSLDLENDEEVYERMMINSNFFNLSEFRDQLKRDFNTNFKK